MYQVVCSARQLSPVFTKKPLDPKQVEVSYTYNPKEDGWKEAVV